MIVTIMRGTIVNVPFVRATLVIVVIVKDALAKLSSCEHSESNYHQSSFRLLCSSNSINAAISRVIVTIKRIVIFAITFNYTFFMTYINILKLFYFQLITFT